MKSKSRILLIASLIVAVPLLRVFRVRSMDHFLSTQRYEDMYYLPPPTWLRLFSIGHREAIADLIWVQGLLYFGEEIQHKGEVRHIFQYGKAILALDPEFRRVYRWVATGAMYRTSDVTVDDIRQAGDFLRDGVRKFPEDGELAWDLGATLAYELAPKLEDPKEKAAARAESVEYLQAAAERGAGPAWLALTNASQLRELGKTEQALRHLEAMYAVTQDPEVRAEMEAQIQGLRDRAYFEAFRETQAQLERERQRDYPYLPPTLFILVGPRRGMNHATSVAP